MGSMNVATHTSSSYPSSLIILLFQLLLYLQLNITFILRKKGLCPYVFIGPMHKSDMFPGALEECSTWK